MVEAVAAAMHRRCGTAYCRSLDCWSRALGHARGCTGRYNTELQTNLREDFTITEKDPTRTLQLDYERSSQL